VSTAAAIARYSAIWAAFGLASGWWVNRWSVTSLDHDTWLTRARTWERDGRAYERLRIRRWKDRLPEAGDFFRGGMSKKRLGGRSPADLRSFAAETRRAESVHWLNIGFAPTFLIWSSPAVGAVMVAFALVVHLPFVAIQRYNRARLLRVLRRQGGRSLAGSAGR